jgi:hypothetical protein
MPGRNPGLANDAPGQARPDFAPKSVSRSVGGGYLCSTLMRTRASLTFAIPRHGKSCGSLTHTPSCGFVAVQGDTVTKADEMRFRWEFRAR